MRNRVIYVIGAGLSLALAVELANLHATDLIIVDESIATDLRVPELADFKPVYLDAKAYDFSYDVQAESLSIVYFGSYEMPVAPEFVEAVGERIISGGRGPPRG